MKSKHNIYNAIKNLKESDFQEDVDVMKEIELKEESDIIKEQTFFSKIKSKIGFSDLSYFVLIENGKIPSYFNKSDYVRIENIVKRIVIKEGLKEYEQLKEKKVKYAEEVENRATLAYILKENILTKKEISKIDFGNEQHISKVCDGSWKKFVDKYEIPNLVERVCEFLEEPGSFKLNEKMIPEEFYK